MQRMVLVVEDDDDIRESLSDALRDGDYAVEAVSSADEAQVRLRDLVDRVRCVALVDLFMPKVSGWDLVRRLQRDPVLARVPVIVTSGARVSEPLPEAVFAFLRKPFAWDDLEGALTRAFDSIR